MSDPSPKKLPGPRQGLAAEVDAMARRKLRARRDGTGAWLGLGTMGVIGWSVVVPTLLGATLGLWLDRHHGGSRSWTLTLLVGGLVLGCANAWHWVSSEQVAMHEDQESDDDV
ncbi:Putative F0F1-ATPase subunit (ATPase_gene1) [Planctomycetes bacterium Poly30]|uniref:F0F1-ATPase subunit (ATPase_gene1) n=1 Tax=Saltatorellus ferox TaxID=2528018 RepID=A0A518EVI8_9BACT|nr:Putative F0F1-ATPase subunit (ATPase_gene1) [Planctomycetes bacterium Poly30]